MSKSLDPLQTQVRVWEGRR